MKRRNSMIERECLTGVITSAGVERGQKKWKRGKQSLGGCLNQDLEDGKAACWKDVSGKE